MRPLHNLSLRLSMEQNRHPGGRSRGNRRCWGRVSSHMHRWDGEEDVHMRLCFWVCWECADSLKEETVDRQTQKGIRVSHTPGSPRDAVCGCAGDPGIPWHSPVFSISSSLEPTHRCRPPRPWHTPQLGARISPPALANPVSSLMP